MFVRHYRTGDAAKLAQITHDAVHQLTCQHYSEAQREAWSPEPMTATAFENRIPEGRDVFVAESAAGHAIGFIELDQDGGIDRFYCAPEQAGRGVGAALYSHLEDRAKARGISRLHVDASKLARPFFEKRGFHTLREQDVIRHGIVLQNYAMQKNLST